MAIFWCDPYIESPSGGVDGTTGVGTLGSYANPYSIGSIPNNIYATGDEIRLKALPANPWLTDPLLAWHPLAWVPNFIGGGNGVQFASAPDQHSFIKYTSIKGEKTYLSWNTPNRTTTSSNAPIWGGMSPYADVTLPAYKLDPQYYLSNLVNPGGFYLLYGGVNPLTITAGWVSETARGGETIIHRINPTAPTEMWFGASPSSSKNVVDAPELTISHSTTSNGREVLIYGETVEVHDIIERSGYGSSCSIEIYTSKTFKANSVASAGYIYIYSPYYNTPATQGVNRDIKHITTAYRLYTYDQGASMGVNLKFKSLACYILSCRTITAFSYYDDFSFLNRSLANQTPTEQEVDPAVNPATVFPLKGPMGSLAPNLTYNNNSGSYRSAHATPINIFSGYLTKGANIDTSRGDVYFRDLVLPVGGTLENTTSHGVKSVSGYRNWDSFHGKAWGVDRNSGRRVAFGLTQGSGDEMMLMYNSTEYNNKLVYHLMLNPSNGRCFDRVHIDMPTGVSEIAANTNLRIKYTLGGAVSTGVILALLLEGNNTHEIWRATGAYNTFIQPSDGGEGTVIYSDTFTSGSSSSTNNIVGAQQLLGVLELAHQAYAPTGVAKICIDSIELEVV